MDVGAGIWILEQEIPNQPWKGFPKNNAGKLGMDGFGWSKKWEKGFVWIQRSELDIGSHLSPKEKNPWIKSKKKEGSDCWMIPWSLQNPLPLEKR